MIRFKNVFQRVKVKFLKQSNKALEEIEKKRETHLKLLKDDYLKLERDKSKIQVRVQSLQKKIENRENILKQKKSKEIKKEKEILLKKLIHEVNEEIAKIKQE